MKLSPARRPLAGESLVKLASESQFKEAIPLSIAAVAGFPSPSRTVWLASAIVVAILSATFSQIRAQDVVANQPGRVAEFTSSSAKGSADVATKASNRSPVSLGTRGGMRADWLSDEIVVDSLARQAAALSSGDPSTQSALRTTVTVALVGLVPIAILMTTSYLRLFVVLSLLRQALGVAQLPSNQILAALSFLLTLMIMAPVWLEIKATAIDTAIGEDGTIDWNAALEQGIPPLKRFMTNQIERTGNRSAIEVFYQFQRQGDSASTSAAAPENMEDVPLHIVLPAFLLSELKVAFLLGFQIFLPFLILDLVVSTVTVSLGMVMLPPTMISLPLKLVLFVMVDGWNLVVGMLLQSFGTVL